MPESLAETLNDVDWLKIFMAIAMAFLFYMQGMSQVQHSNTKEVQAEHAEVIQEVVTKEAILEMIVEQMKEGPK